jgi:hypothetical protein
VNEIQGKLLMLSIHHGLSDQNLAFSWFARELYTNTIFSPPLTCSSCFLPHLLSDNLNDLPLTTCVVATEEANGIHKSRAVANGSQSDTYTYTEFTHFMRSGLTIHQIHKQRHFATCRQTSIPQNTFSQIAKIHNH